MGLLKYLTGCGWRNIVINLLFYGFNVTIIICHFSYDVYVVSLNWAYIYPIHILLREFTSSRETKDEKTSQNGKTNIFLSLKFKNNSETSKLHAILIPQSTFSSLSQFTVKNFPNRTVNTKSDIYVFISIAGSILLLLDY